MTALKVPVHLVACSWPRPVEHKGDCWISEPHWDALAMPVTPQPYWEVIDDQACLFVDWREVFRRGVRHPPNSQCGEMCGFHVVFRLDVARTGVLQFWDDDGSVIRRNGLVIHDDRTAHSLRKSEIAVTAGDRLEVAQWQLHHSWAWGCRIDDSSDGACTSSTDLLRYLDCVRAGSRSRTVLHSRSSRTAAPRRAPCWRSTA